MSAPGRIDHRAAGGPPARQAGRARRAEQGAVSELARLLARDARQAARADTERGGSYARQASATVRRRPTAPDARLRRRTLAARPA